MIHKKMMTNTMELEDIVFYRDAEGDIRGEIDIRRDGIWRSESFGIYASGNWEFKGWMYSRFFSKEQKQEIEDAILAKVF